MTFSSTFPADEEAIQSARMSQQVSKSPTTDHRNHRPPQPPNTVTTDHFDPAVAVFLLKHSIQVHLDFESSIQPALTTSLSYYYVYLMLFLCIAIYLVFVCLFSLGNSQETATPQLIKNKISILHATSANDLAFTQRSIDSFVLYVSGPDIVHEYLIFMPLEAIQIANFCRSDYTIKFRVRCVNFPLN